MSDTPRTDALMEALCITAKPDECTCPQCRLTLHARELERELEGARSGTYACCGEYATCKRACTPRGEWQARNRADYARVVGIPDACEARGGEPHEFECAHCGMEIGPLAEALTNRYRDSANEGKSATCATERPLAAGPLNEHQQPKPRPPPLGICIYCGFETAQSDDSEAVAAQIVDHHKTCPRNPWRAALAELVRQIREFVAENGEANFYTGDARRLLGDPEMLAIIEPGDTRTNEEITQAIIAGGAPKRHIPSPGVEAIAAERERQITAEGWTPEHDDEHDNGSLPAAAACYAFVAGKQAQGNPGPFHCDPAVWMWDESWWKPKDARRNLVRAGALIAAEIDRLDRAAGNAPEEPTMDAPAWTPIAERRPEYLQGVLLYFPDTQAIAVGVLDVDDRYCVGGNRAANEPSHWMPLVPGPDSAPEEHRP